jgi:5-methyltetrahydropteroyltriglutamate--homocysteine methyltransferase
MLQLDEPAMTRYHDKLRAYGAKALDRCLEGVTVPTLAHLCYGYPLGQESQHHFTYPPVFEALLPTRISGFTVEFARSHYDPAVLAPCRDRLIMFGCIDPGNTPAPAVDDVKTLVRSALKHLDPRRLMLAPDCGLVTLSRALARQKLAVMVQAARELRREL